MFDAKTSIDRWTPPAQLSALEFSPWRNDGRRRPGQDDRVDATLLDRGSDALQEIAHRTV